MTAPVSTDKPDRIPWSWMAEFLRPHGRGLGLVLLLSLAASAVALVQPWLLAQVIDLGLLAKDFDALIFWTGIVFATGLLSLLAGGVNRYLHTRVSGRILFDLREAVFTHLTRLAPRYFAHRPTGDLIARLDGDVAEVQRFAVDGMLAGIGGVLGLLGGLGMLFWLEWRLALIALLLVPLQFLFLRRMRPKVERQTGILRQHAGGISSFLVETLPAMKFIQAQGTEATERQRFAARNSGYLSQLLSLQILEFITSGVPGTLMALSRVVVLLIGGLFYFQDHLTLGALIAFNSYLGMALSPIQTLLGLYLGRSRMLVSLGRLHDITRHLPEVTAPVSPESLPADGRGTFDLSNVEFAHDPGKRLQLNGVSFRFPGGSKCLVTGPSGAGKSTLADLLMRHADPDRGQILLDGIDIRRVDPASLRREVALVSQDVTLFAGTIADNLRYGQPDLGEDSLDQALQSVGLADLPDGLETRVGERGWTLSGGQRQRLALARALLRKPRVLILDEATSALDAGAARQLHELVDRLFADRTRIIITHHAALVGPGDYHLELSAHEVAA